MIAKEHKGSESYANLCVNIAAAVAAASSLCQCMSQKQLLKYLLYLQQRQKIVGSKSIHAK